MIFRDVREGGGVRWIILDARPFRRSKLCMALVVDDIKRERVVRRPEPAE